MNRRSLRSLLIWMASLAVLMGALAPSISQMLQTDGAPPWGLICSVTSAAPLSGKAPKPDTAHVFEHCPYCTLHVVALTTPGLQLQLPLRSVSHALHWRYVAATPTLDFWSDAQSRAPPVNV